MSVMYVRSLRYSVPNSLSKTSTSWVPSITNYLRVLVYRSYTVPKLNSGPDLSKSGCDRGEEGRTPSGNGQFSEEKCEQLQRLHFISTWHTDSIIQSGVLPSSLPLFYVKPLVITERNGFQENKTRDPKNSRLTGPRLSKQVRVVKKGNVEGGRGKLEGTHQRTRWDLGPDDWLKSNARVGDFTLLTPQCTRGLIYTLIGDKEDHISRTSTDDLRVAFLDLRWPEGDSIW